MTTDTTLDILDMRLDETTAKLDRLTARADKLGVEAPGYVLDGPGKPYAHCRRPDVPEDLDPDPETRWEHLPTTRLVIFDANVRLDGHKLLAKCEVFPGPEGNLHIVKALAAAADVTRAEEDAADQCEHCEQNRQRRYTYLIETPEGRRLWVGKTCLKDFLGHGSAVWYARVGEWLAEVLAAGDDEDEWFSGGGMGDYLYVSDYLVGVAAATRLHGFHPSRDENATKYDADTYAYGREAGKLVEPEDYAKAHDVRVWAALVLTPDEDSDYLRNLRKAIIAGVYSPNTKGLLASAVSAFDRARAKAVERDLERRRDAAIAPEGYYGTVGDRVEVEVIYLKGFSFEGHYGTTYIEKLLLDDEGVDRLLVWKGKGLPADVHEGDTVRLRATVKGHETYRDEEQTLITRAKVV